MRPYHLYVFTVRVLLTYEPRVSFIMIKVNIVKLAEVITAAKALANIITPFGFNDSLRFGIIINTVFPLSNNASLQYTPHPKLLEFYKQRLKEEIR